MSGPVVTVTQADYDLLRAMGLPASADDLLIVAAHRTATEAAFREREAGLLDALETLQSYGCPRCNGDCGSANPPVMNCPMQVVRAAKYCRTAPAASDTEEGGLRWELERLRSFVTELANNPRKPATWMQTREAAALLLAGIARAKATSEGGDA